MSYRIEIKYNDLYKALAVLEGLKLHGALQGPPTSKLPLRLIVENSMANNIIGRESYRDTSIVGVKVTNTLHLICHFNAKEPDDFCIALEGDNPWNQILEAANKLYKATKESYTLMLAAIVHAIYGIITGEEEEIEEVKSVDQVIEELLTWLPEYIVVVD